MPRHPPNALTTLNRSHCQCSSLLDLEFLSFALALKGVPNLTLRPDPNTWLPFTTRLVRCHRRVRHDPIAGTPVHCEVMSLRPASRDLSDDARSGNINPASSVRDFFARLSRRILRSFAPQGRQTIGDGPQPYQSMVNNNNASGQASFLPPVPPPYPAG
jgi:hypothetical protein